jgi:hypothetical protein
VYKLVRSLRHGLAQAAIVVPSTLRTKTFTSLLSPPFLLPGVMAHHASSLSAARISTNGTIIPYWYNLNGQDLYGHDLYRHNLYEHNLYEHNLQPAQNANATQESPTISGISSWGQSGSSLQLCIPKFTTSQASYDLDHALNYIPDPLPTKKSRKRKTKVCAACKKRKTKCVLGEEESCVRCEYLGVECTIPAARLFRREKYLKSRSGMAPRQKCVFATMREMNLLTYEQEDHRPRNAGLKLGRRVASEDTDIGGGNPRDCKAQD